MNGVSVLSAMIFSPGQLAGIIILAIVLALTIAGNVLLFWYLHKSGERRLCTNQLQNKRDELLKRLEGMRGGVITLSDVREEDDESEEDRDDDEEDDDEDDDEDDEKAGRLRESFPVGEISESEKMDAEILAVADMSEEMRYELGLESHVYDRKRYYVRYSLGFEAKLHIADDETKARYAAFADEVRLYSGVKIKESYKQQRIYRGRKTLGIILFRGKTLCVAFALNPADYAETKYRGIDKSDKKRFNKTPMLYKLSSARRLEYAKYLLLQVAAANTVPMAEKPMAGVYDLTTMTYDQMFVEKMLRIMILGEVPQSEIEAMDEAAATAITGRYISYSAKRVPAREEITVSAPDPELATYEEESGEADDDEDEPRVRYNRSFTARTTQANDALKARYSELKNYLLSYSGVADAKSWKRETFRLGRNAVAAFAVRGKTLCIYLASNPAAYVGTKYKVVDLSARKANAKMPLLYRIKGDRHTMYAKQLIANMFASLGVERTERKPLDYTVPYKSTEGLIRRGLIRVSTSGESKKE